MAIYTFNRLQDSTIDLTIANVKITAQTQTSITVAWDTNAAAAASYTVDWGTGSVAGLLDSPYTIPNLTIGTAYTITVYGEYAGTLGDGTQVQSATIGQYDPPNFTVTVLEYGRVLLAWDTPVLEKATHVDIFKRETAILDPFDPAIDTPYARIPIEQTSFEDKIHEAGDVTYQAFTFIAEPYAVPL